MTTKKDIDIAKDSLDQRETRKPLIDLGGIDVEDIDIGEFMQQTSTGEDQAELEYLAASCTTCVCTCSCCSSS